MILEPHVVSKPFTRVNISLGGTQFRTGGEGHTFLSTQEMKRNSWGHSIRAALKSPHRSPCHCHGLRHRIHWVPLACKARDKRLETHSSSQHSSQSQFSISPLQSQFLSFCWQELTVTHVSSTWRLQCAGYCHRLQQNSRESAR